LQAKAKVSFINLVPDQTLRTTLYPDVNYLAQKANALNALGFLRPALVSSKRVQDFADGSTTDANSYGSLDGLTMVDTNTYVASGWANLPNRGKPADAVILAYEAANGDSITFALAYPDRNLDGAATGIQCSGRCWKKSFSIADFPIHPAKLSAWAFDANSGKAFQLRGSVAVP